MSLVARIAGCPVELRCITLRLKSRVYQSKIGPLENRCPSPGLDSTTSAAPLGGRCARQCVVPCLAGGPGPDNSRPILLCAPVGGSDFRFPCMFRTRRFLMMTWALSSLSLIPIVAMPVRILFTSHDRCWPVGSLPYLPCHWHLATCASASISGSLVSSSDRS